MPNEAISAIDKYSGMALDYLPQILLAIATLIIGFWIIARIVKFAKKGIMRSGMDETLANFLSSLISIGLKIMLLLSVASMFGVNTTSFIAVFSALMVGIGMALNGTIGHIASGVMLMIFKPFKVGDLVKIGGNQTMGTVEDITAFNTVLKTLDNQRIIIANSNVTGNDITNVTGKGEVGVELTYGIGYSDDIDKARKIILDVGASCPHILTEPAQGVVVSNLGDSSVDLSTRPFCKPEHFWDVKFFMQENVKKEFDKQGIGIPYPTLDINMVAPNQN